MELDKRIEYTRIALGICSIAIDNKTAELLVRVNDLIIEKEGSTDLHSICNVLSKVEEKYKPKIEEK